MAAHPLSPEGRTLVVVDTCVLLQTRLSDIIFDLYFHGKLFDIYWTKEVEREFLKNAAKLLEENRNVPADVARSFAEKRLRNFRQAAKYQHEIFGYESESIQKIVPVTVDVKDRHVVAAAIKLLEDLKKESGETGYCFIVLTENLKDMGCAEMKKLGIDVLSSGEFIDSLYAVANDKVIDSVKKTHSDLKAPPMSQLDFLQIISRVKATNTASNLASSWGVDEKTYKLK